MRVLFNSQLLFSPVSLSLNSIQGALLAWGEKIKIMNSKHYTHKSSKGIETFQMSYYVYIQCCNNVQIMKVQKGK